MGESKTLLCLMKHWSEPRDLEGQGKGSAMVTLPFDLQSFCVEMDKALNEMGDVIAGEWGGDREDIINDYFDDSLK